MNKEQFWALFSQGSKEGSTGAEHALDQQNKLAQLIKGKQVEHELDMQGVTDREARLKKLSAEDPNSAWSITKEGISRAPKDNTLKNAGIDLKNKAIDTNEESKLGSIYKDTMSHNIDSLKSLQELQSMMSSPNTMNEQQIKSALAKLALNGQNRVPIQEIQNILGPKSLWRRGKEGIASLLGQPQQPFTEEEMKTIKNNVGQLGRTTLQSANSNLESFKKRAPTIAGHLHQTGQLPNTLSAITAEGDTLYKQMQDAYAPTPKVPTQGMGAASANQGSKIMVKSKATGQVGTLDSPDEFDPKLYDKVQ